MRKSYLLGGALLAAALFVTTSCKEVMGSLDNPVKPYIELEKTTATLEYGQSTTIVPSSINDKNPIYTFESLNPEIATVDEATGEVTAVDYDGEATIIAKVAANEYYQKDQTEFKVIVNTPAEKTPLSFEAVEDGKIIVSFVGDPALEKPIVAVTNGVKQEITETTEIEVVEGQKVRFFSENDHTSLTYNNNFVTITTDKEAYVYGNVMSMVTPEGEFKDNVTLTKNYALTNLFSGAALIKNHATKAIALPATTLTDGCYQYMFNECKALTEAPVLPATEMKYYCYGYMFLNCTALTKAPELPATTLANNCYNAMFQKCSAIKAAPELPATELANNCYYSMFNGCSNLVEAPELKAEVMTQSCYYNMFKGCKALTKAPELPATTLASDCYRYMFQDCEALTSVSDLPAEILQSKCYYGMFQGCKALETAPEIKATSIANTQSCRQMFKDCTALITPPSKLPGTLSGGGSDFRDMFNGCISLTSAPELPATTLGGYCYAGMFQNCSALTVSPYLPALTIGTRSYQDMFNGCTNLSLVFCNATSGMKTNSNTSNWLNGVASNGTFYKNAAATVADTGDNKWNKDNVGGIPENWNYYNL